MLLFVIAVECCDHVFSTVCAEKAWGYFILHHIAIVTSQESKENNTNLIKVTSQEKWLFVKWVKLFLHTWAGTKSHESTQAQTQTYAVYRKIPGYPCALWLTLITIPNLKSCSQWQRNVKNHWIETSYTCICLWNTSQFLRTSRRKSKRKWSNDLCIIGKDDIYSWGTKFGKWRKLWPDLCWFPIQYWCIDN